MASSKLFFFEFEIFHAPHVYYGVYGTTRTHETVELAIGVHTTAF